MRNVVATVLLTERLKWIIVYLYNKYTKGLGREGSYGNHYQQQHK